MRNYEVKWQDEALENLSKLDEAAEKEIKHKVDRHLASNPFWHGKELSGRWKGFWRHKVDDYRAIYEIVYKIEEKKVIVSVAKVGPRGYIYQGELPKSAASDYGYRIINRPKAKELGRKVVGNRGKRKRRQ